MCSKFISHSIVITVMFRIHTEVGILLLCYLYLLPLNQWECPRAPVPAEELWVGRCSLGAWMRITGSRLNLTQTFVDGVWSAAHCVVCKCNCTFTLLIF